MATKHYSDINGDSFSPGDEVRVVVYEHPDLDGPPVELEALPEEIAPAIEAALHVAVFEVYAPGEAEPRKVVVEVGDFDALATDTPMAQILKSAPAAKVKPVRGSTRSSAGGGINYATLEHAGKPHRGRVTEAEARIVREHLDEVNARLGAEGLRRIDPTSPEAEKYGFEVPVPARDAS